MGYPLVKIHNSTNYKVSGKVRYMSAFCSDDDYSVEPGRRWTAKSRGVCLLTKVSATIHHPKKDLYARPYTSTGTSYSEFAVIKMSGKYAVTRVVTLTEDDIPADYVEPTTEQK